MWAAVFPAAATAEEVRTLDEVTVSAEKEKSLTAPSLQEAHRRIQRVPGGADIVDSEEYKKGRASTLQDVLKYSPGVFAQPRFGSDEARLSIRGSGLQRTFHLRGIKLLQDGVPLNEADGGGDFQALDPLAVRYVEVFRGANALQHGASTLGGAINFVTPTGHDAAKAQARAEGGSFGYLRTQTSSGQVIGPADYYASLSFAEQQGYRVHSEQNARRFFGNAGWRFSEDAETRFYVSAVDSKSNLPGSLTKRQLQADAEQANASNISGNQKRDFDLIRLSNKTAFAFGDDRLELGAFWARKDLFHPIFQVLDIVSDTAGAEVKYLGQGQLFGRDNLFTVGAGATKGIVQDDRFANLGGARGARTAKAEQTSANIDLYGENQFYVLPKTALVGGLQFSHASRKNDDDFLGNGDHSAKRIYHGWSPKAGVRHELTPKTQVFANVSRSFEPPSFGELVNTGAGGLTRLKEQTANTVEVGTRGEEERFLWDLVYYMARVRNELLSLNDGSGNPLGTVNAHETLHEGVEAGFGLRLLKELVFRQAYTWSRFRFHDDPVNSDNRLPGVPEHFYRAELVFEHPTGWYAGPNVECSLSEYPVDMRNTLYAGRYILVGFKTGYKSRKGFSLFLEGKNLTDETYAATTGVIADAAGADSAQFLPGDGLSAVGGIEWRW